MLDKQGGNRRISSMPAKKSASTESKFNKTQILEHISVSTGVSKKEVSAVLGDPTPREQEVRW
jgi:hypothetical protein